MFSLEISLYKSESVEDVSFAELLRNGIFSYLCRKCFEALMIDDWKV